jgi:serine/threonine protein kinase
MKAAFTPGSTFAGYRVEALVDRGGMGVVYQARDLNLERRVALKLVVPELAEDERFRARLLREPRLAASLDHPSVIPIYEAGARGAALPGDALRGGQRPEDRPEARGEAHPGAHAAGAGAGRVVGTLDYLAPEQIRGDPVDGRTDVCALGCLLYECLSGAPPYRRETEAERSGPTCKMSPARCPATRGSTPCCARRSPRTATTASRPVPS